MTGWLAIAPPSSRKPRASGFANSRRLSRQTQKRFPPNVWVPPTAGIRRRYDNVWSGGAASAKAASADRIECRHKAAAFPQFALNALFHAASDHQCIGIIRRFKVLSPCDLACPVEAVKPVVWHKRQPPGCESPLRHSGGKTIHLLYTVWRYGHRMTDDLVHRLKERGEQHRRFADHTHDRTVAQQLRQWAAEIDADINACKASFELSFPLALQCPSSTQSCRDSFQPIADSEVI